MRIIITAITMSNSDSVNPRFIISPFHKNSHALPSDTRHRGHSHIFFFCGPMHSAPITIGMPKIAPMIVAQSASPITKTSNAAQNTVAPLLVRIFLVFIMP
jgi:hypothetical protein